MVAELEKISYDDSGGFRAEYITEANGFWHFHPEYEIILNTRSNGTRIIGDSVELFDRYDLVMIGGNIPHCWNYYRNKPVTNEEKGIMVHFRLSSLGEPLLSQHEMTSVRKLLIDSEKGLAFSVEDARKSEPFLVDMVGNKGIEKMINFLNLLRIMVFSEKKMQLCSDNYKQAFDEKGNRKMTDVYNYIRENYHKSISLEKISRVAHMSPFAFSRYFKKNCGAGFIEYLNRVRMNKACYLLRETEYQVHEVANECGFSSISNFNKTFRKAEGQPPREYRAQFR
ncbi:MAG: AraC family transcriptional regulator [Bacteroidales bacterium]